MDIKTNFLKGRMNKGVDERILPLGEYRDALNVRLGSTEGSTFGALENTKGDNKITTLEHNGTSLSTNAVCIGAYEDGTQETLYWFVHDPTRGVDMVVSYNTNIQALNYHLISTSVLNFNPKFLVTGVDLIDNFLFFTDDLNPPRVIDVNKQYSTSFTEADISVLKPAPINSPSISLKNIALGENFIDIRFLCFAYRYRYEDNQYSALSQFSDAAFCPSPYFINAETYSNDGMLNVFNAVDISFNVGGSEVVGIDLCFKQINGNILNVIQKFNKEEEGWVNNSNQTIEFSNSKIFTTLPTSELLRLFDNVPLKAKAQTEMSNRIFYGNYLEGYNIAKTTGEPILINYTTEAVSESIGTTAVYAGALAGVTSYVQTPNTPGASTSLFSMVVLDFSNVTLEAGDIITIDLTFFRGTVLVNTPPGFSGEDINEFSASVTIILDQNYANADALAQSTFFQNAIGTSSNVQNPVANSRFGTTLSDNFATNCNVPVDISVVPPLPPRVWEKYGYYIQTAPTGSNNQGFFIRSSSNSSIISDNQITLQTPAMMYNETTSNNKASFLFKMSIGANAPRVSYIKNNFSRSLHSNKDYEIGLVYMDSLGRNTTVLASENNTVFFPISTSNERNKIKTTINNIPPPWAARYKFAIRDSSNLYETIFVKQAEIFTDTTLGTWFLLEGQNQTKASVGDLLIVKVDSFGAMNNLTKVEILDIQVQPSGFITDAEAGLYMKLDDESFAITGGALNPSDPKNFLVFETIPVEGDSEVYYEGSKSFAITGGFHQGNVQNQTGSQPAISNLEFFNCYTFGNGVESYKIEDSLTGNALKSGNRTNAIDPEGYRQKRNESAITYSGVYNPTSNVNKLNEFNLALANFKDLERDFGSIQKLHSRGTDVLVIQEDKISYVLASKNILHSPGGGGVISSIPEVIGNQIARIEEYGISLNPESFTAYGFDRYFTDAKRGAVLKLTGSGPSEKLEVISNYGMRSWFRDRFIESFDGQKLGGYDPYMNEYVLSIKDNEVDMPETIIPCGAQINANDAVVREFTVELGNVGGFENVFVLTYTIGLIQSTIEFEVIYNGVAYTSGNVSSNGTLSVPKTTKYPTQAVVKIKPAANTEYELTIGCVTS